MRKSKLFLLLSLVLLLCAPVCAQAKVGSTVKGAQLPKYKEVVKVKISAEDAEKNFSKSVNDAIESASDASSSKQYKIIIPAGTYEARGPIYLNSNIWISAEDGVHVVLSETMTTIIYRHYDNKERYKNVRITGGIWDGSRQPASPNPPDNQRPRDSSFVYLSHFDNLLIEDATFKVHRARHILEFSDIKGLTVRGCKLSGNNVDKKGKINVQPKEALQIDVATKGGMSTALPHNGKGCHNVLIEKNTFTNVARGIGSHNENTGVKEKNPYTNITVRNNTVKNALGEGIFVLHWKNCTIENNTISNCKRAGIYLEDCKKDMVSGNKISSLKSYTGKRLKTYPEDYSAIIIRIVTGTTIQNNKLLQKKGQLILEQWDCANNTLRGNTQNK